MVTNVLIAIVLGAATIAVVGILLLAVKMGARLISHLPVSRRIRVNAKIWDRAIK